MINLPIDTQFYITNYSPTQIEIRSFFGDLVYLVTKEALVVYIIDDYTISLRSSLSSSLIMEWIVYVPNVLSPSFTDINDLVTILNGWANGSYNISVNNANSVGMLNTLNFVEGSNITITTNYDSANNKTDVQIDASGGGGGLPPDGTYGDVVVSGSGTVWTVTDDTSNQQVAVYEDSFIRGTRPSLNFYDDGGIVSVTVTDNPGNNAVDIGISTTLPGPVYLVAHDENTQTAAVRDTGYPMSIDWTDESNGITINSHTKITFSQDGVYNIQFSAQFSNNDTQLHDVDVWFQKNDAPIPWSNSRFTINASHGGDAGHYIGAWNFMSTFLAGDFVEIYWETDDVLVVIETIAAVNDAPETPSIILTVDKL